MPFNYGKVGSESSTDDEQQMHPGPGRVTFWTRICDTTRWLRWPFAFFFLIIILIAEISILNRQPVSLPIGAEINGIVPHFGRHRVKFIADPRYASDHKTHASINATKQHWLDLMPKGAGFLHLSDYTTHTLPPPMHFPEFPGKEMFAIAVFHQIHCLYHMQSFIDTLALQIRSRDWELDEGALGHMDHCFNYLRNEVMCASDLTLEGQAQTLGWMDRDGTDGTGGTHVCRDFEEVKGWAEGKRVYDNLHL